MCREESNKISRCMVGFSPAWAPGRRARSGPCLHAERGSGASGDMLATAQRSQARLPSQAGASRDAGSWGWGWPPSPRSCPSLAPHLPTHPPTHPFLPAPRGSLRKALAMECAVLHWSGWPATRSTRPPSSLSCRGAGRAGGGNECRGEGHRRLDGSQAAGLRASVLKQRFCRL